MKKSEREDLEEKLGLIKDNQLTPNMIDRAKILAKRYFDEKGYKNAEINIVQQDDVSAPDKIILDVNVEKKDKVKVNHIYITGNNNPLKSARSRATSSRTASFKKTHERGKMAGAGSAQEVRREKWKEDKENLITKYDELGYRDARIVARRRGHPHHCGGRTEVLRPQHRMGGQHTLPHRDAEPSSAHEEGRRL